MVAVTIAFLIAVIFVLLRRKRKNQELQNIVEMKSISDRDPTPNVPGKNKRSKKLKISCSTKSVEKKLINNLDPRNGKLHRIKEMQMRMYLSYLLGTLIAPPKGNMTI